MSKNSEISRSALLEHLKREAVRTDGPFTLRSGEVSSYYIDARQTTFDGLGASAVGRAVLAELPEETAAVGGMTMGADPIAISTAVIASLEGRRLKAFSIRKQEKAHGTGGRLVGPVAAGMGVAVVEDTTTTGAALVEAIDVARAAGLNVLLALALVDRSSGAVAARMADMGIRYVALFAPGDLGL